MPRARPFVAARTLHVTAVLVTLCTRGKRLRAPPQLMASSIEAGAQGAVAEYWLAHLNGVGKRVRARALYKGRGFAEALATSANVGVPLWVASAGLGLVPAEERVPAYDLTVSPGAGAYVGDRVREGDFSPAAWWRAVNRDRGDGAPLAALIRSRGDGMVVVTVTRTYLKLLQGDLLSLTDDEIRGLRLVGLRGMLGVPERLRPWVMPYDGRLDGPRSPLRGAQSDFAQRAARHFVEHIVVRDPNGSARTHAALVEAGLAAMGWPVRQANRRVSDAEVDAAIRRLWGACDGRATRILRELRDAEGIACEQGRFRMLYRQVAEDSQA
jgi:hypothetical protein